MPAPAPSPTARLSAGDPALRDGPASNAAIEREALNNRRYLRGSAWGQLVWSERIEVSGTAAAPVVKVGVIDAVSLCDGDGIATGTWRPYNWNLDGLAADVGASAIEGGGSLAGDSFYYLYAFNDGTTTLAFQLSLTPPTPSGATTVLQQWKRGQTCNYRYLGCFPTDGSGNPFPLRATRRTYLYVQATAEGVYTAADTLVSLAGRVPPHTRHAICRASVRRGNGSGPIVGHVIEPPADIASPASRRAWGVAIASVAQDDTFNGTFEVLTNASREVRVVGGADSPLILAIEGFRE